LRHNWSSTPWKVRKTTSLSTVRDPPHCGKLDGGSLSYCQRSCHWTDTRDLVSAYHYKHGDQVDKEITEVRKKQKEEYEEETITEKTKRSPDKRHK
jgi:hypothetical protein